MRIETDLYRNPSISFFFLVDNIDVENPHHILYLLKARENELLFDLKKKMAAAVVFTKVRP